jgi:uncharacterized repeat protein (TIGR01451 family)
MTTHLLWKPEAKRSRRESFGLIILTALLLPGSVSAAGLSISLHHNRLYPTTVESYFMGGTNGTYTINVVNSGPATTGLITVTDTLPDALTFVSAVGDNWNCAAVSGTVTCLTTQSIPSLGTSSSILLTVMVAPRPGNLGFFINLFDGAPRAIAVINNAATVAAANANIDNSTQVDVVTDGFVLNPGLVLEIRSNSGPSSPTFFPGASSFIGSSGSYSITLLNDNSAATVAPVSISFSLPGGMTVAGEAGANWTCTTLSCTYLPSIPAFTSSTVLNLVVAFDTSVSGFVQARATITDSGGAPVMSVNAVDLLGTVVTPLTNHWADTLTTIQATPNPTFRGVPVTITATTQLVSGGVPSSGTVSFSVTGNNPPTVPAGPVNIDLNGQVSFVTIFPAAGEYTITASFTSAANTNPSHAYYVQRIDFSTPGPTINGNVYTFCNTNPMTLGRLREVQSPLTSYYSNPDPLNIFVHDVPGTVQTVQVDLFDTFLLGAEAVLIGPDRRLQNLAFLGDPYTVIALDSLHLTDSGIKLVEDSVLAGGSTFSSGGSYQPWAVSFDDLLPARAPIVNATSSPSVGGDYNGFFPYAAGANSAPLNFASPNGTGTFTSAFGDGNPNGVWSLGFGDVWRDLDHIPNLGTLGGWCVDLTLNLPTDSSAPALSISKAHNGSAFTNLQNGSYSIIIANTGTRATTSAVTVTDVLPAGLSFVSAAGTNWSCGFASGAVTCTSTAAIPAHGFSSVITLTVSVNTGAPIMNTATVSGGGGVIAVGSSRDTVLLSPAMSVAKTHAGTFTQGGTGEWDITVSNGPGSQNTNGNTTLSDTLPAGYTVNNFSTTAASWICSGAGTQTATCTSTSAVAGGASFPVIKIFANIPSNSPVTVSNTGKAFGGGDPIHNNLTNAATGGDSVSVVQAASQITATAGTPQGAAVNTAFATNLQVTVKDAADVGVLGASVTFQAPASGPSGSFASPCSGTTCVVTANASGVATAPVFTANGTVGGPYNVTATVGAVGPANFSLTNSATPPLQFVPIASCRVMDTREAAGPFGGPSLAGGASRTIQMLSSRCGIPASAKAYSVNATVVPKTGTLGYLTLWPTGQPQPNVSTLNAPDGSVLANAAVVPAGAGGSIDVFAQQDTEFILDINGYFKTPGAGMLAFYPTAPCRAVDTRTLSAPFITGNTNRSFPLKTSPCPIPAAAQAYSLNITVVPRTTIGSFITAWPTGQPQPGSSVLNTSGGTVLANAAIVGAGAPNGAISIFSLQDADVIVDVNGYFAPPGAGGLNFYTVNPCRAVDTRGTAGPLGGPIMNGNTSRTFPLAPSACGLPVNAGAYSLNMTVVPTGFLGFLTVWPTGVAQPNVSTLNDSKGIVTANAAVVSAGTGGAVDVFVLNTTHVIIDVNGYFAQ